MPYAAADIIQWAKISQVLAYYDSEQKQLTEGGFVDKDLHQKIKIERERLEWEYAQDPTSDYIYPIGNYVFSLCFPYAFRAMVVSGGGGSSVTPSTGASAPLPIQFIVAASGTTMINGQSSVTLSDFIGYNLLFVRGGISQSTVGTEPSSYSWDKTTGAFVCTPAAITGELFQLYAI